MSELLNNFNLKAAQGFRHNFDGSVEAITPAFSVKSNPDLASTAEPAKVDLGLNKTPGMDI